MRVDFGNQQLQSDEVQRYVRLARITRNAIGAAILGGIGLMAAATLPPSAERGLVDASVSEMQLYALPPLEGVHDAMPAPAADAAGRSSDEELRNLGGVVHHG